MDYKKGNKLLEGNFESIHGLVHCSGRGQTKCMKYLPGNFKIVKDNLFEAPPVFTLLHHASGSDLREMYQVFNMEHRLEVFTDERSAESLIEVGAEFGIEAKLVGRVEAHTHKELELVINSETIRY